MIHAKTEGKRRTMTHLAGAVICLLFLTDVMHGQASSPETQTEQQTEQLRASVEGKGPHQTETLTERDGIRNGPGYKGATIYYPVDLEGPLPGMAIVPGFMASERSMRRWGPYLASHGIVTMTIGTNERRAMPEDRADALLDALTTLKAENTRADSPLNGRIDTERMGVGGWSMGGGGAQHAAVEDPELDAVLALCPWKPGYAFEHPVPVMILAGEDDNTASSSMHALVHYRKTPEGTPKLLFEVEGGGHFLPSNTDNAEGDVGRIALLWLMVHLLDDDRYRPLLEERPSTASRYDLDLGTKSGSEDDETD